uniref:Uncharacterized protein n=1 Tax=Sinocyclocheilus grahami TaxID=75366 RepID=A0A672T3R7_SINGR
LWTLVNSRHSVISTSSQIMFCVFFGQKQTLLCILDCVAHLLKIPEEVENAFFERTIKAFTWVSHDSENGQLICKTLKDVMIPVLHDLRTKAMEELELTCHCSHVP